MCPTQAKQNNLYVLHVCDGIEGSTRVRDGLWLGGWSDAAPRVADATLAESRFKFFLGAALAPGERLWAMGWRGLLAVLLWIRRRGRGGRGGRGLRSTGAACRMTACTCQFEALCAANRRELSVLALKT